MKDDHRPHSRRRVRLLRAVLRVIALLTLGLLAYGGVVATQHAYTRHLGPWVIVFVVGAVIVTPATWFYPRPIAIVFMWIGAVLASLRMVVVFINGLIWEPVVGVCVLLTFEAASVYLSALWWPLRHFSSADRRAALLRLRKLPYRERRRVMWSRRYDQLLSEE